jgi:ABC-2 type transport system permease protein
MLGFSAAGVIHTLGGSATLLIAGALLFDVRFDPNLLSLLLIVPLYLLALIGFGLVMSAIGLRTRRANPVSNLVFPFLTLLGGSYYPVDRLPALLRVPARALPLGYAMDALAAASLRSAAPGQLVAQILPLAGFAVVLPVLGALAVGWVERLVRRRGELDLY